jgi:methylated-DNA-[protein]-cysteine S-methyltransferase
MKQKEVIIYLSAAFPSPVGDITLASEGENLTGLWFEGQGYYGNGALGAAPRKSGKPEEREMPEERDGLPIFAAARKWLRGYFAGKGPSISELPLAPAGGEFRQGVWNILRGIPYGEVVTYGEIAKEMARKMGKERMAAQAVGGAVGHNPISIIIPCHRVVGAGGNLTGYGGGMDRKVHLLEMEGVDMAGFFVPKKSAILTNMKGEAKHGRRKQKR